MLYWFCLALVLMPLLLEQVLVARSRSRIPLRIHVHGTRGKSSVVRECARLLRRQGLVVLAKTTGDRPEFIMPDGQVQPIRRIGPARIKEHVATLQKAARLKADAVVVEGMALTPETIWQSQNILCATHLVITNTRPDHAESMGIGRQGVVRTLALMIPEKGELIAADEEGAAQLVRISEAKKNATHLVESARTPDQTRDLATAVVRLVSPRRLPVEAPAVTVNTPHWQVVSNGEVPVRFLDLMSANDVESSLLLWEGQKLDANWLTVALLATRADRPLRSRSFWTWLLDDPAFDLLVPQGDHAGYCWLRGWRSDRLLLAHPWSRPGRLLKKLVVHSVRAGKSGIAVIGLGNVHGVGETWRRFTEKERGSAR